MPCGVGDIQYGETDTSVPMAQSCNRTIWQTEASGKSALQIQSADCGTLPIRKGTLFSVARQANHFD
jgi:hypothetical protein